MDAGTKQLADILNGNRVLEVPYYQRSYVWKEEQWARFISDMEYITSTNKDYFLGSIILKQQPTGISSFDLQSVIDGQQRFTTFALFFKSLCLKTDDPKTFEDKFMVWDRRERAHKIAIRHSINDRKDFEAIVALQEDVPYKPVVESNISRAYNYFQENINPDKLDVDRLLTHVIFIGISLQQGEDEQVIFDTINSLGVRLTTGELLKNYFFTESTREEYEELWAPIFEKDRELANYWDAEVVSGRLKRTNIDFFFSAYLFIKIQDPAIKVSADHKMRYRRSEGLFNNYKDLISTYNLDKKTMIYDILEYALLYHDNINPDIAEGEIPGTSGIERMNFLIFVLEYTTIVPYVLFLLKNVPDLAERNAMFGYIESYILRRLICKSDNKNFSDLFAENLILNQVTTLEGLKDYLANKDDSQALAIPRDQKVFRACHGKSYPNKKALAILYLLETAIREGKPHATRLYPFDRYSLEHLMPRSWKENWPLPEDVTEEERDDAVYCLGNLAMLPQKLNTSISNASWDTKKSGNGRNQGIVFYASDIETLTDVVTKSVWDETTISERSNWIAQKAIEIWPSYLAEEGDNGNGETEDNNMGGLFVEDDVDEIRNHVSVRTSSTNRRTPPRDEQRVWMIPSNSRFFDLSGCFKKYGYVYWRQHYNYQKGDIAYIYSSYPHSAILFKVAIDDHDLPFVPDLELQKEFYVDPNGFAKAQAYKRFAKFTLIDGTKTKLLDLHHLLEHGMKAAPQGALNLTYPDFSELLNYIEEYF